MPKPRITLTFVILLLSLTACTTLPTGPVVQGSTPQAIRDRLAAICPVPSTLTPAQAQQIASALTDASAADKSGITLLATEWDRLNEASKICRGQGD